MLRYLFAKLSLACTARYSSSSSTSSTQNNTEVGDSSTERLRAQWSEVLVAMGITPNNNNNNNNDNNTTGQEYEIAMQLVNGEQLSVEEWTVLREYFQRIGRSVLEAKEKQKNMTF